MKWKLEKPKTNKNEIIALTDKFIKDYKGKINTKNISSNFLLSALQDLESLETKLSIYGNYYHYCYVINTLNSETTKLYQASEEFDTHISSQLIWFGLELKAIPEKKFQELVTNPNLSNYHHYLTHLRVFNKFTLSEKEEIIMTKKSQSGIQAFTRLYDDLETNQEYDLLIDGKKTTLNYSQLSPILTKHKNRNVRKKAIQTVSKKFQDNARIYTSILNAKLLDKKINDDIRGYTDPRQGTFLSYEVTSKMVDAMSQAIENHYHLQQRFYLAKAKLLKLPKLYEWDRYSDIYPDLDKKYTYSRTKEIILSSFGNFNSTFKEIAQKFFENNWIDAKISKGKVSGAFCSYNVPSNHPYILTNFNGESRDISTLAHELGHGIHSYLSKNQALVNFYPSTATAEIASVFAENIVFEKLFSEEKNKKNKINLLGGYIQDMFATVFRQNAFYLFEKDIHQKRQTDGELQTSDVNKMYQKRLQDSFGTGLTLSDDHQYLWMPIHHFYHYNFYVFTYSFGQLLTLTLFAKYKNEGNKFVTNYIQALSKGGSHSVEEIISSLGVDITNPNFWTEGLKLIENYITEFENLTN